MVLVNSLTFLNLACRSVAIYDKEAEKSEKVSRDEAFIEKLIRNYLSRSPVLSPYCQVEEWDESLKFANSKDGDSVCESVFEGDTAKRKEESTELETL